MPEITPTVADVRRALVTESDDYHERRKPHFQAIRNDGDELAPGSAYDAYEAFVAAGSYAWLLAALLRRLTEDHGEEYVAGIAPVVQLVIDEGIDWLEDANSDLGDKTGTIPALQAERKQLAARIAELESSRNQLRHTIDTQAHRLQSADDRIAELEAELKGAKTVSEQCTATTGRRLTVQCSREAGHSDAHTVEVGGGRISWHGETASAGA